MLALSLASVSLASDPALGKPLGYWNASGSTAAAIAAATALVGAQQAAVVSSRYLATLAQTNNALNAAWAAQNAARAAAAAVSSNIVDGLGKGTSGQTPGLVVDPRVATDSNLWINADRPVQTTANGKATVTINQTDTTAILTWEYFNVSRNTTVVFNQQGNTSWVALNRIDDTGVPSQILGSVKATGTVLLINPNGIIFGGTAQINVGSLIATTEDLSGVFRNYIYIYSAPAALPDGVIASLPQNEDSSNQNVVANGLYGGSATSTTTVSVGFDQGASALNTATPAVVVEPGAQITGAASGGTGAYVALIAPTVYNGGAITVTDGTILLEGGTSGGLTTPTTAETGVNLAVTGGGNDGTVINDTNALLLSNDGNVTLGAGHIEQRGVVEATTSVSYTGSITIVAGTPISGGTDGNIILTGTSVTAILPDETSGTIPTSTDTSSYFTSTLQPQINVSLGGGSFDMQSGALIKAPSAAMTISPGQVNGGAVLLESGSTIDLSGTTTTSLPMSANEITITITAAEVADYPNADSLIGKTVTIDARTGSPILDDSGYIGNIAKSIDQVLGAGGSFTVKSNSYTDNSSGAVHIINIANFVQEPGAVLNIDGGYITYQGGVISTTKVLESDGRIYDIGSADPNYTIIGIAGQFTESRSNWASALIFTNPLFGQGYYQPTYVAGTSAGSVSITTANNPVLEGTIYTDTVSGIRQRAFAEGGGTTTQASLDYLPTDASLSITIAGGGAVDNVLLESSSSAGSDPYGLSSLTLANASSWTPAIVNGSTPLFTDVLTADDFGSININVSSTSAVTNMASGSVLTVRPGGSVTLNEVETIDGTINAQSGSITLTGSGIVVQRSGVDVVIGPTAVLNVRGLWINDTGAEGDAFQGSAFINGGSITITTPYADSIVTAVEIVSGTVNGGGSLASNRTEQYLYVTAVDATGSIVLAPGSVLDLSSGGYVSTSGKLKYGSDGLPSGKGGNLTLEVGTNAPSYSSVATSNIVLSNGTVLPAGSEITYEACPLSTCPENATFYPINGIFTENIVLGGTIYASGFDGGGTLTLSAPTITIGGTSTITSTLPQATLNRIAAETEVSAAAYRSAGTDNLGTAAAQVAVASVGGTIDLPGSFFTDNDFSSYVLASTIGQLTVTASTDVLLRQGSLLPGGTASAGKDLDQPTGAIPRLFESFGDAAYGLRKPVSLTLDETDAGDGYTHAIGILVDQGASIQTDPGASGAAAISLSVSGQSSTTGTVNVSPITILGDITALSGTITLGATNIWLGPQSVLDVDALYVPNPLVSAYSTGTLLDAGTISISGGQKTVVSAGAQLLLAGGSATIQYPEKSGSILQKGLGEEALWSNGGTLSITASNLYFAGTVDAAGGAPEATGGTLTVSGFIEPTSGVIASALAAAAASSGLTTAYPLTGNAVTALTPSTTGSFIGADTLNDSGFSSITLGSATFVGSLTISVPGSLIITSNKIYLLPASSGLLPAGVTSLNYQTATSYLTTTDADGVKSIGGATVTLDAGYVSLGYYQSNGVYSSALPQLADGTLNVNAQWIDLQTVSFENTLNTNLTSSGGIRFGGDIATGGATGNAADQNYTGGAILAPGNLTLTAAEIFPVTESAFFVASEGKLSGVDDTLTIRQTGVAATPLSAGGVLVFDAENIVQAGTIEAPLGNIVIGLSNVGQIPSVLTVSTILESPASLFVATKSVTLAPGSVTSVSTAGSDIPYGYTVDGTTWYLGAYYVSLDTQLQNATVLSAPPSKSVSIFGTNVAVQSGASINETGGGDIYAVEFDAGTGGSRNVLNTAASGQTVYALVPSYELSVASYDPTFSAEYNSSSKTLPVGETITIGAGSGIAAGTYVLLPGMYATLPGAYRVVEVQKSVNPSNPSSTTLADGSMLIAGKIGNDLTGAVSSTTALFEIQSQAVWSKYSGITITSGTSYFTTQAAANGTYTPQLPIDGGTLILGPTGSLSLAGSFSFSGGTSDLDQGVTGASGQIDISASTILVLAKDQAVPAADTGYLVLDAGQLSALGANILIGGTAASTSTGTTITETAKAVEVLTDAANPLTDPDITIVTQPGGSGITVDSGSVIAAVGSVAAGTDRPIAIGANPVGSTSNGVTTYSGGISGDGSMLRVSNGSLVSVTRNWLPGVYTGPGPLNTASLAGFISIGSGATLSGANITIDATKNATLSSTAKITARDYALTSSIINVGGGSSGLVLSQAFLANLSGAQSVTLTSYSVIDFYDQNGLTFGDPAAPIGTLTFDAAGLSGQGGTTVINAQNIVFTNSQSTPQSSGALSGANGTLIINASSTLTESAGIFALYGYGTADLDAGSAMEFSGSGSLQAGSANVTIAAPVLIANAGSTQAVTTSGTLTLVSNGGTASQDLATNIGDAVFLTGASISDSAAIEALSGNVTLTATAGDLVLNSGATIFAGGSEIPILDQIEDTAGGAVKLVANAGNVTINNGARVDVSGAGIGYAGSLTIDASGLATLNGTLTGSSTYVDTGGSFTLTAGQLAGTLPLQGFTTSFDVTLGQGNIVIGAGTTLRAITVQLVADVGSVIVDGTIDSSSTTGGTIALYGTTGVTVDSSGRLLARYQAADPSDPAYANDSSTNVQTGGTITLGTSGTTDGTYNATYGYENVATSGAITVASGAVLDVSGGPGGYDINNTGGTVYLRAPILESGGVNVAFHGTLVTTTNSNSDTGLAGSTGGIVLEAYAAWSTTDATTGGRHFDGIIDPAGFYNSSGTQIIFATSGDIYPVSTYRDPATGADLAHVDFYQNTLTQFVQTFSASADFSGAQVSVNGGTATALSASLEHDRPEIDLINPSSSINGGNITVASNWNLGAAGTLNVSGAYVAGYQYRTSSGEPGVLTLAAENNVDINATITDGFSETKDAFNGSVLVADLIANNPAASGSVNDYNTTGAASLMSIVPGANDGSFSYDIVAGAAFVTEANGTSQTWVDPNVTTAVAASGSATTQAGSVLIGGYTSYTNAYKVQGVTRTIYMPTLVRTGTGSITITAAGDVAFTSATAEGAIYTAGAVATLPTDFTALTQNTLYLSTPNGMESRPTWAAGGGAVTITAGQSIIGVESSTGYDWNLWYYHAGEANPLNAAAPFTAQYADISHCNATTWSCQTQSWINYATFQGTGALGGGNVTLIAGNAITGIEASLPETIVVSGGTTASDPAVEHVYGGGDLIVRAGGNLNSDAFFVGRGAGLIVAGGSIQADPSTSGSSALVIALQDGFVSAIARGSIALADTYDPATVSNVSTQGNTNDVPGAYLPGHGTNTSAGVYDLSEFFTSYGEEAGLSLDSTSGSISVTASNAPTLELTAALGSISATNIVLTPIPSASGSDTNTFDAIAGGSLTFSTVNSATGPANTGVYMPDLTATDMTYVGNSIGGYIYYYNPLGTVPNNESVALHAQDMSPVRIVANGNITGEVALIKPAYIEAGGNISLQFVGQNNNADDLTLISAGGTIGGFESFNFYYLYGPGDFVIEAGGTIGPLEYSNSNKNAVSTSGIVTIGNGSNLSTDSSTGALYVGGSSALQPRLYLPNQGANISVLFGIGKGIDYQDAIADYVNPASAGLNGIDFLPYIASLLGESEGEAWATFQNLPAIRQQLLVQHAFLDFLTQVGQDYYNTSSAYYGRYNRAYTAIATLFPASYGYTDNQSGSGNGAATKVVTGNLDIAQSLLETQMGGNISILGPGGKIVVGSTATDSLGPRQEGIVTLAGGSIQVFTDGDIILNQSRIMTADGGDIDLFTANGGINAGSGPKTTVSDPAVTEVCDKNGHCRVNPQGLITGAGIAALVTLPGQDPADSNVSLLAPHGTVDLGSAGLRAAGNATIIAQVVLNAFNAQIGGTSIGLPTPPPSVAGTLSTASNAAGSIQASIGGAPAKTGTDTGSVIIVEVLGYGGGDGTSGSAAPAPSSGGANASSPKATPDDTDKTKRDQKKTE